MDIQFRFFKKMDTPKSVNISNKKSLWPQSLYKEFKLMNFSYYSAKSPFTTFHKTVFLLLNFSLEGNVIFS
ncbi:hypothetical protein BSM4216_0241 [Bacillus smithii]|nr:hypothetical protein BSM4216_0241 [Bacillus smithii]